MLYGFEHPAEQENLQEYSMKDVEDQVDKFKGSLSASCQIILAPATAHAERTPIGLIV